MANKLSSISSKLVCVCCVLPKWEYIAHLTPGLCVAFVASAVKGAVLVKDSGTNLRLEEPQHGWSSGLVRPGTMLGRVELYWAV